MTADMTAHDTDSSRWGRTTGLIKHDISQLMTADITQDTCASAQITRDT